MTHSRRHSAAGYTLLEMLIVVAVMGLVLSLIALRGPTGSPALSVRAAAGDVAQALRAARAQAISEGRSVALLLDAAHHQYITTGTPPRLLQAPARVTIAMPIKGVRFDPDGSSSGGVIAVAEAGHTVQLSVSWLTGRVSVEGPDADRSTRPN